MARRTRVIGRPARTLRVTRRGLLVGAAAGGGLLVAWRVWPRAYPGALVPAEGEHGFGAWLTIGKDGIVTVAVPEVEMGQGVTTVLPQIVAHELGADWRQIAVQPVPPNGAQANAVLAAKWGAAPFYESAGRWARANAFAIAADGTTLAAYETPAREAGAAARAMLTAAAAERWGVEADAIEVRGGLLMAGGKTARFGELAAAAAALTPPDPAPLRPDPPRELPLGETAGDDMAALLHPRLDLPSKVDGSLVFAGDVRLPGMLHAAIRHGPVGLPFLADEDAPPPAPPGVRFVRGERWLAAAAPTWWEAERALRGRRVRFTGPGAVDSGKVADWLAEGVKGEGRSVIAIGDADAALADGDAVFAATYAIAPAVHAPLETASATARVSGGRAELWIASQAPEAARRAAARALELSARDVTLYPMPAGGSFDARLETAHAAEAVLIARALRRPIQLTWSRAEELKALPPRTPVAIGLTAKLDPASAQPAAWRARIACPATTREFAARLFAGADAESARAEAQGETDPLACEGAMPPYACANIAVEHVPVTLPFATARLRGNALAYTAFATEIFIDELARRAGRDPLLYRLGLLAAEPRLAAVLQRAARLGGWDGGRAGSGQGLALTRLADPAGDPRGGGYIACVAQARIADGGPKVDRLTAAVDIGRIVNLDIARQQIEGGLIFGLAHAAGGALRYAGGRPVPERLEDLRLPRLADAPAIEVEFAASTAPPCDPGELGVVVAPPAIANALFAATGVRHRTLPLIAAGA